MPIFLSVLLAVSPLAGTSAFAADVSSASISGTAKVGETLTASTNEGATNVAYQWKECDTVDGSYTNIDGATTSTYVPTAEQVGKFIEVTISGDNNSSETSDPTEAVADATPATVAVTGVTLDKSTLTLNVGETGTLTATVTPETATENTVTWSSSDDTIATVDKDGKVTAVAEGTATITAKAGDQSATCAVTVSAATPAYTLTIGAESNGGVGYTRTITVDGKSKTNLDGKYLVTAITEGSGDNAKVSVVMFALTGTTASVSYQTKGATVETWIVSADSMPTLTAKGIVGTFDAHATTAD